MNEQKTTAQDFFLNLGVTVTLYTVVISFLSLVFSVINRVFPDVLANNYYYGGDLYSGGVRFAMATLIIVFPLFLWLSKVVVKSIKADPVRRNFVIRRWLVYITIFLASVALITDLIVLLNTFLAGEISVRFILKVVAVLVVAGIIFWYYLAEARNQPMDSKYKIMVAVASVLVIALIVTAFSVFGSPNKIRNLRADKMRTDHLQAIQWQIINYWQQKGALPKDLASAENSMYSSLVLKDLETGKPYGYEVTGKMSFKLCADFALDSEDVSDKYGPYSVSSISARDYASPAMMVNESWKHPAGTYCFDRTIDPDFYPVYEKPVKY